MAEMPEWKRKFKETVNEIRKKLKEQKIARKIQKIKTYPFTYLDFLDFFILKNLLRRKVLVSTIFYGELLKYFDVGPEAFRRRMVNFVEMGIVKVTNEGNPKVYSFNPEFLDFVKEVLFKIESFVVKNG
jgi:hypothetical protein